MSIKLPGLNPHHSKNKFKLDYNLRFELKYKNKKQIQIIVLCSLFLFSLFTNILNDVLNKRLRQRTRNRNRRILLLSISIVCITLKKQKQSKNLEEMLAIKQYKAKKVEKSQTETAVWQNNL